MAKFQRKKLTFVWSFFFLCLLGVSFLGKCDNEKLPAIEIELTDNFGEFLVVNRGTEMSLNSEVSVENEINAQWKNANVSNLLLRETCSPEPVPKCVTLKVNSKLAVVAWTGNFCSSQCPTSCRLDGQAPPGKYRFTIHSCDDNYVYHSPTFELPAR